MLCQSAARSMRNATYHYMLKRARFTIIVVVVVVNWALQVRVQLKPPPTNVEAQRLASEAAAAAAENAAAAAAVEAAAAADALEA